MVGGIEVSDGRCQVSRCQELPPLCILIHPASVIQSGTIIAKYSQLVQGAASSQAVDGIEVSDGRWYRASQAVDGRR